jgi:site-specific recombinase XerD
MRRWDGLVEQYLALQVTKGLAEATIIARRRELARFGGWLKGRRPKPALESIGSDLLVRFVSSRTPFHSRSTVGSVVSILRSIGEFLVQEGIWAANPLRWMRGPKIDQRRRLPRRIGQEQLRALWKAAEARRREHARYQAVCALAILYGTGLRRGELERLDLSDWDRENSVLKIDGRKSGRERQVPVGEGVWRCIEGYLPHRHNRLEAKGRVEETALLVNDRGDRLTGQLISTLIGRLGKSAGIEAVTPHQFRHSCASDLIEAGVTIPEVQGILGHASIASTVRYTAIADPERAKAMSKHPLNRFLGGGEGPGERRAS